MKEKFGIYVTKIGNIAIGYIGKYVTSIKIINNEDKNEINKYIDNRNKITDACIYANTRISKRKKKIF